MFNIAKLALAGALFLGAASAVQAKDDDADRGGYRIGPLGQEFPGANPAYHRSMRYGPDSYAYVPGDYRFPSRHYRAWSWDWDR
jgi:hypothetical protein